MNEDKFIEIFEAKAGNIKQTCKAVGIARSTYYEHYKTDTFKKRVDAVLEGMIDDAESQLHLNMMDGKETSLIFFLKTRAKHRGYIEKQEMDITATQEVHYYAPKKDNSK